MPDFAAVDTPRVRVHYRVQALDHSIEGRMPIDDTIINAPDYINILTDMLTALVGSRYSDWSVLGYDFRAQDSEVAIPISAGSVTAPAAGTVSTSGRVAGQAAAQMRFEGRSTGGSKCSITLFGTNWLLTGVSEDFRITYAENSGVANAIDALNNMTTQLRAIDGQPVVWKQYVNLKYNDRVMRRLRNI